MAKVSLKLGRRSRFAPVNADTLEAVSCASELLPLAQAYAADNPGFARLAELLKKEEYQSLNFGKLLEVLCQSEVSFSELALNYQSFQHAKVGLIRSYHMPRIMHNLTIDANPRIHACPRCYGTGKVRGERLCARCGGTGQIEKAASNKARALILESAGMIGKTERGPLVNVNMPVAVPAMEQAVMEAAKVIAHPAPRQLEPQILEVVPDEDTNVPHEGDGEATQENR